MVPPEPAPAPRVGPRRPGVARLALALGGVALALGLGEGALRLLHPTLPSLEALEGLDRREVGEFLEWSDPALREAGCVPEQGRYRLHYRQRSATYAPPGHPPSAEALDLWVAGDSLVAGWGVGQEQGWPHGLARALASARGARVRLTTVGGGGLGYCEVLADTHHLLARGRPPDALVVQLFADDLEQRNILLLRGRVAARPDAVRGPLGWLVGRSWLANRVWFAWVSRLGGAEPARSRDDAGAERFRRALTLLAERAETEGFTLLFALVPPAGVGRCGGPEPWSDCDWLRSDLDWMAGELASGGLDWVDLRQLWQARDPQTLPDEEAAWEARRRLPVHPGVGGHAALAEAVLPDLMGALGPDPSPAPAAPP